MQRNAPLAFGLVDEPIFVDHTLCGQTTLHRARNNYSRSRSVVRTPCRNVAAARPQVAVLSLIPGVFVGRLNSGLREVVPSDWVFGLAIRDEMSRVRHGHTADHFALDLPLPETTAMVGIAMKRPMAGWDNACIRTELGILMRLLGPLSHALDATRARCYKSAHPIAES